MPPRRIAILGSTGSIGQNALQVAEHLGQEVQVVALSAHSRGEELITQVRRWRPAAVALTGTADPADGNGFVQTLRRLGAKVYLGPDALPDLIRAESIDVVLLAVVGAAGLPAAMATVQAGKTLALANKESLVMAGSLLIPEARRTGATLLPVDSEHSAIFQALACGRADEVERVILTASGGPFRNTPLDQLEHATPDDALRHPTWSMGHKITIDSATMFNKGLEVIEACWLFDLPPAKVQVVVHPESVVHSMVEFVDGSVIAQLSPPDMRTPIQYALTWPQRRGGIGRKLDLTQAFQLRFEPPDPRRFPALALAYQAAEQRGTLGAVLNAANETAVRAFLDGQIPFGMICRTVELTMRSHAPAINPSLEALVRADQWARQQAQAVMDGLSQRVRS